MKISALSAAVVVASGLLFAASDQADDLKLPQGFHATVVADGLGQVRHLAVRDTGELYFSTPQDQQGHGGGIVAVRLDATHKATDIQHFGTIDGGTGIRFSQGMLYASSPNGVYRFMFNGSALVPSKAPETILEGTAAGHPGFNRTNRPIALDGHGHLFVALDASANLCTGDTPPGAKPVGLKPCPDLATRA